MSDLVCVCVSRSGVRVRELITWSSLKLCWVSLHTTVSFLVCVCVRVSRSGVRVRERITWSSLKLCWVSLHHPTVSALVCVCVSKCLGAG